MGRDARPKMQRRELCMGVDGGKVLMLGEYIRREGEHGMGVAMDG